MVQPRFRALEQIQRDVRQVSQARSGMIGRGRVLSVDLLRGTATVERYGRGGQTAQINNVAVMGIFEAAQVERIRGQEVYLLFSCWPGGSGETVIMGLVYKPEVLYNSLETAASGQGQVRTGQTVQWTIESDIDWFSDRDIAIAAFEVAAYSVIGAVVELKVDGNTYSSVDIPEYASRPQYAGGELGAAWPVVVLVPTGEPWTGEIPVGTALSVDISLGASGGSYRYPIGTGSEQVLFSPNPPTASVPLMRIRGSIVGASDPNQFLKQIDTPATYQNAAGFTVKVNSAGTGLEFVDVVIPPHPHPP